MKEKWHIIENKKEYVTKYGSELKDEKPAVVYLRSKIKITPKVKQISFENEISRLKDELKNYINNEIQNNVMFENRHLCNIDISGKSVTYKKISYMRIDIYLKPILPKTLAENLPIVTDMSNNIKNKLYSLLDKYNLKCSVKNI